MIVMNQCVPFNSNEIYGNKYNVQNMEIAAANFKRQCNDATDVWSDRLHSRWYDASAGIKSEYNGDLFWKGVSEQDLIAFGKKLAQLVSFEHEVTGIRIVRFSDMGGYPVYRADLIYVKPK